MYIPLIVTSTNNIIFWSKKTNSIISNFKNKRDVRIQTQQNIFCFPKIIAIKITLETYVFNLKVVLTQFLKISRS